MEKSKWKTVARTSTCRNMCHFSEKYISANLCELYYVDEAASWELLSGNTGGTNVVTTVDFLRLGIAAGASLLTQAGS